MNSLFLTIKQVLTTSNKSILFSSLFYFILAITLTFFYRFQINPDGVSYISLSLKYIHLDWNNSINGYWGPLFSWLLMPLIILGIKPLLATKILSLIIGYLVFIQSNTLLILFDVDKIFHNYTLPTLAIIIIYFSLITISPDLLFVLLILIYLNIILRGNYFINKRLGYLCGTIGGLLYLTKSYGFPFFLCHYFIFNLYSYLSKMKYRKIIIYNFSKGLFIFILISSVWVALISCKYGYLTIGTAAKYNNFLIIENVYPNLHHPMHYIGLLSPPNETAISIWEDIGVINWETWSLFDSLELFKHQISIILQNILFSFYLIITFSFFSPFILFISFSQVIKNKSLPDLQKIIHTLLIIIILYSGYLFLIVDRRYIWISCILLLILGIKILNFYFNSFTMSEYIKRTVLFIFLSSFLFFPLIKLYTNININKDIYNIYNNTKLYNINGRFASNSRWHDSLYLSFYNGWQYFGEQGSLTSVNLKNQLEESNIDYFLLWEKSKKDKLEYLNNYEEITKGKIKDLKIYSLKIKQ